MYAVVPAMLALVSFGVRSFAVLCPSLPIAWQSWRGSSSESDRGFANSRVCGLMDHRSRSFDVSVDMRGWTSASERARGLCICRCALQLGNASFDVAFVLSRASFYSFCPLFCSLCEMLFTPRTPRPYFHTVFLSRRLSIVSQLDAMTC